MRMLLPILWFVLNVLSFNTFSDQYEQKKHSSSDSEITYWIALPADNSSGNKPQIYFLPEEFEENVEEDSEHESEFNFFSGAGSSNLIANSFLYPKFSAAYLSNNISYSFSSFAYRQAKFIFFRNLRI